MYARPAYMYCNIDIKGVILPTKLQWQHSRDKYSNVFRSLRQSVMEWLRSYNKYVYTRSCNMRSIYTS